MEQLHRDEWQIGLSSWVVQDGTYVDFAVGERRQFAVGFFADDLHERAPGHKYAKALGESRYDVSGEVIVADHGLVMLDFGLLAYTDSRPPFAARGEWLAGRLSLEVDCYSYFEIHAKRPSVPPAVYAWTISGIWRQTAPFIPDAAKGPRWLKRDPDRLGWGWLARTDAWSDDDGHAEYLLRCRLEPDVPVRHP